MTDVDVKGPSLAVTMIEPEPLAEEVGTTVRVNWLC